MPTQHTYALGPVKSWVSAAATEIGNQFNVSVVYGFGPGSVSGSDHPKGLALDFMVIGEKAKGDAIAEYAISNADRLGITYVIWYRRIWQNGAWKDYHGSPNPHTDHVHISFSASGGDSRVTAPVTGEQIGLSPASWPIVSQLNSFAGKLTDPGEWRRVGYFLIGAFLIVVGITFLFGKGSTKAIGKAV
jgi:hypothetical protein